MKIDDWSPVHDPCLVARVLIQVAGVVHVQIPYTDRELIKESIWGIHAFGDIEIDLVKDRVNGYVYDQVWGASRWDTL